MMSESQEPRVLIVAVKGLYSQATAPQKQRAGDAPCRAPMAAICQAARMSAPANTSCARRARWRAAMAARRQRLSAGLLLLLLHDWFAVWLLLPGTAATGDIAWHGCLRCHNVHARGRVRARTHLAPHACQQHVWQQQVCEQGAVAVGGALEGRLPGRHKARRVGEHAVVDVGVGHGQQHVLRLAVRDQRQP